MLLGMRQLTRPPARHTVTSALRRGLRGPLRWLLHLVQMLCLGLSAPGPAAAQPQGEQRAGPCKKSKKAKSKKAKAKKAKARKAKAGKPRIGKKVATFGRKAKPRGRSSGPGRQTRRERAGWAETRRRVVEATRTQRADERRGRSAARRRWLRTERWGRRAQDPPPTQGPTVAVTASPLATAPAPTGPTPAPAAPTAPPVATLDTAPAVLAPQDGPAVRDGFLQGFQLDASTTWWAYVPVDSKGQDADWGAVETAERYHIPSLQLYRLGAQVDLPYARLAAAWQSNRGLTFGGEGDLSLLNLMVALGVPGLDRLSVAVERLAFAGGDVALVERASGATLQRATFRTELLLVDGRIELFDGYYLSLSYVAQSLPRNVYLGLEGPDAVQYVQVSDQLLLVDSQQYGVGLGYTTAPRLLGPGDGPWLFGVWGTLGLGPYTLRTLTGRSFLDEGLLFAATLGIELGVRVPLGAGFTLGLRNVTTLNTLQPLGLSDDLEAAVRDDGGDPDDYRLAFGVAELINQARVELTWAW